MNLEFIARSELGDKEWDNQLQKWDRPPIDRDVLRTLNQRSSTEGMVRLIVHALLIIGAGWLTLYAASHHLALAIIPFLLCSFLNGFLNGIEHELRHRIVFSKQLDVFSDFVYFFIHLFHREGAEHQRVSHRTHHRYTMVQGVDPETDYPAQITERWVWKILAGRLFIILTLGIPEFFRAMWVLLQRASGRLTPRIAAQCSPKETARIRRESAMIFTFNLLLATLLVWQQRWGLACLLLLSSHVGLAIASLWYLTEHIGMMFDTNDQRFCTRGVQVTPPVRFLFGGLDEHVEHHLFPAVPSRNLTKLREALNFPIPKRKNVIQCWLEILAIARHKEQHTHDEFVPDTTMVPRSDAA